MKAFKKLFLWEKFFLLISFFISIFALILMWNGDSSKLIISISIIAVLCGIISNLLASKSLISNYYYGIIHVICYGYIAFYTSYYGDFILNIFFYLPLMFLGFFLWKRRADDDFVSRPRILKKRHYIYIFLTCSISYVAFSYFLKFLGGAHYWLDASSTILSVSGMILMNLCCWEQWIFWILVNIISITMWILAFMNDNGEYTLIFVYMWSSFLLLSIMGLIRWIKISRKSKSISRNYKSDNL